MAGTLQATNFRFQDFIRKLRDQGPCPNVSMQMTCMNRGSSLDPKIVAGMQDTLHWGTLMLLCLGLEDFPDNESRTRKTCIANDAQSLTRCPKSPYKSLPTALTLRVREPCPYISGTMIGASSGKPLSADDGHSSPGCRSPIPCIILLREIATQRPPSAQPRGPSSVGVWGERESEIRVFTSEIRTNMAW